MNVFKDFENRIKQAVQALDAVQEKGGEVSFERLAVEPPRDPAHGDISTNAAMVLAKPLGMNPRALADMIAAQFADDADVAETAVAGPGFLNFRLTAAFWRPAGRDDHPRRERITGGPLWVRTARSMSSMFRQIRQGRCMSAIAAARLSAMRWRT
jgi:hypothetical protein